MKKNILSRVVTVLLALAVSFFCISAFLAIFYITDSIINIYTQGVNAYNSGKITGEIFIFVFSILIVYLLGRKFKN